jgi:hypothetical protein
MPSLAGAFPAIVVTIRKTYTPSAGKSYPPGFLKVFWTVEKDKVSEWIYQRKLAYS